ncbi:MAG: hypothetical protein AAF690_30040, partial [Acidobacteriota bacterium]
MAEARRERCQVVLCIAPNTPLHDTSDPLPGAAPAAIARLDATPMDPPPECVEMPTTGDHSRFGVLQAQLALPQQPRGDRPAPSPEIATPVSEQEQVVDVPNVGRQAELSLHVSVELLQVQMGGEQLARRCSERQTPPWRRPVRIDPRVASRSHAVEEAPTALEDLVDDREEALVRDPARQELPYTPGIDAREEGSDVQVNGESVAPHGTQQRERRSLRTAPRPTAVARMLCAAEDGGRQDPRGGGLNPAVLDRSKSDHARL